MKKSVTHFFFKTEPTLKVILPKACFYFYVLHHILITRTKGYVLTVTCERDQKQFTDEQIKASLQNGAHKLMFYKGV